MANTLKFGNGEWYGKKDTILAYNDENYNYKPLPFSFDRASSGTVVNKAGLIETVGSGEPRIDYKDDVNGALLLEPARTNYVTYSNDFTDSSWLKTDATAVSGVISPDGTSNAFTLSNTASSGIIQKAVSLTGLRVVSIFAKKGTHRYLRVGAYGGTNSYANFDLENGVVADGANANIENYGNGWFRCICHSADGTTGGVQIFASNNAIGAATTNGSIQIYGAQLEAGSYATSYIPTQGSAVTRLADACFKDDINTTIINSSYPFSMYAESTYVGGNPFVLSFSKKVVSNNYYVITISGNNEVLLDARANGSTELIESGVTLVDGQKFKVAITMESATSGKICVNGNAVVSKTNFSNQAVNNEINDLLLGQLRVASDTGNRLPITDARLYNTALTDSELQTLTTI